MFLLNHFVGTKKAFPGVKYDKVESNDTNTSNNSYIQRNGEVILKCVYLVVNLGIFVATTILFVLSRSEQRQVHKGVFSPASEVVEYHNVQFTSGTGHNHSIYHGIPNEENEAAWRRLLSVAIIKVPNTVAEKFDVQTSYLEAEPDYSVTSLDVFHQLHCLYHVRRGLYPAFFGYKNVTSPENQWHTNHCLDYLVQGVMCSADISPISWSIDNFHDEPVPDPKVLHTCRNFEKIWEWSRQHRIDGQVL